MAEYIEREAIFKAYEEEQRRPGPWRFETLINSIPSADVAPVVHGRWIGEEICIETGDISATLRECSQCHRIRPVDVYCSHCGAEMDLKNEGEEEK